VKRRGGESASRKTLIFAQETKKGSTTSRPESKAGGQRQAIRWGSFEKKEVDELRKITTKKKAHKGGIQEEPASLHETESPQRKISTDTASSLKARGKQVTPKKHYKRPVAAKEKVPHQETPRSKKNGQFNSGKL